MKQVIAFLVPSDAHVDHPQMIWEYFTGFDYNYSGNYSQEVEQIVVKSKKLCDAYVFSEDSYATLRTVVTQIKQRSRVVPQIFSVSNKRLFEARLKDE